MADAISTHKLVDNRRNAVIKLTNLSDGTGESAVNKVDVSALDGAPDSVAIDRIEYDCNGMRVDLLWDATADTVAATLSGQGAMDFKRVGGLQNNSGAGKTGDIHLTTNGHTAGDGYTIVLHLKKKYLAGR
jgi:hypothetical protein